jgi:hypothetical protein
VTPLLVKLSDDYPAVKVVFELITTITSFAVKIAVLIAVLFALSALGVPIPIQGIGHYQ